MEAGYSLETLHEVYSLVQPGDSKDGTLNKLMLLLRRNAEALADVCLYSDIRFMTGKLGCEVKVAANVLTCRLKYNTTNRFHDRRLPSNHFRLSILYPCITGNRGVPEHLIRERCPYFFCLPIRYLGLINLSQRSIDISCSIWHTRAADSDEAI